MTQIYCLKCKKHTDNIKPHEVVTPTGKHRIATTCGVCGIQKSRMIAKKNTKNGNGILDLIGGIF